MILRFILTIYWTVGWCYRLATRKYPKIPYVEKNITINGTVIGTVRDPKTAQCDRVRGRVLLVNPGPNGADAEIGQARGFLDKVTIVEDIWFNDTTCEEKF